MSDQDNKDNTNADQATPLFTIGNRDYDVDAAVNKITSADNHISTLEQETAGYKQKIEELEAKLAEQGDMSTKLDEALAKLTSKEGSPAGQTDQVTLDALRADLMKEVGQVSHTVAVELEKQKLAEANTSTNIEQAKKKFGTEYETKLREEGAKLGFSDEDIQKLASGNPEQFKRLFGLTVEAKPSDVVAGGHGGRGQFEHKVTDLPNPSEAWNSAGRVDAVRKRLEAKLKEKGIN